MCVCVCVCVCMCICVCVCVRIPNFSLLDRSLIPRSWFFRGSEGSWLSVWLLSRKIIYFQQTIRNLLLSPSFSQRILSSFKSENLIGGFKPPDTGVDSKWGSKRSRRTSNYCKFSSVSSLLLMATRGVYERSTIKVWLSTERINERFGTAIAIWVFSIGSYSSTTGVTVICHSQNEQRCKNLPMNRVFGETTQNRRKIVFFCKSKFA